MRKRGSQPVAVTVVSCLNLFSFLLTFFGGHWVSSVASYLVGSTLLSDMPFYCLEESLVHLKDGDWSVLCCFCCGGCEVPSPLTSQLLCFAIVIV